MEPIIFDLLLCFDIIIKKVSVMIVLSNKCPLLGIETSCDETGVAVVVDGVDLKANVIASHT